MDNVNNVIKLDFIDELRIEGIKYKGYGVLPKYVMIDPDLTIEAKGIYAYFCSYAGSGNTAFPSRDKIVADLQINKDTYYKHFNVITSQGYIVVEQAHAHGGRGDGFTKNIYTLISNPKKFEEKPEDRKQNQAYIRIRFGGLEAAGFGFIPKAVMLDTSLPLKAKAIYAYFCGFTGSGNAAFPKVPVLLHHLGITKNTYYKFFNMLLQANYITTVQRYIGGRLSVNDYYLNDKPNAEIEPKRVILSGFCQSTNFSDTQAETPEMQYPNFSDTQSAMAKIQCPKFSDTQKQDTQKQDTQNSDTNINSNGINKFNINQSIHQQAAQPPAPAEPDEIERLSDEEYIEKIEDELTTAGTLPYSFLSDDKKLTVAIRSITEWQRRNDFYNNLKPEAKHNIYDVDLRHGAYNLFVEALIEMLTPQPQPMKLKGAFVSYSKVYDRLVPHIKQGEYSTGLYLETVEEAAVEGFINGCRDTEIRNHLQYMKACIWTALQTGEIGVLAQIKHDFG